MSDKAKKRRSSRDAKYYEKTTYVTQRNKLRRELKRQKIAASPKTLARAEARKAKKEARRLQNLARNAGQLKRTAKQEAVAETINSIIT